MIYRRHYVQFNDLVFDGVDMAMVQETTVSFKTIQHEYTFKHGSYSPFKRKSVLASAGTVSITLKLDMKKLPCDDRKFYPQFAVTQLTTPGKLWAVYNNTLMWAYAALDGYTLVEDTRKNQLIIDVDFTLPEGVWHKADKQRTFLVPYDICDFMDCYNYKEIHPCHTECCQCPTEPIVCDCCYCHDVTKDMALCYYDDLQDFYSKCGAGVRIVYDCQAAERFFGGFDGPDYLGQKFCSDCGAIYGMIYSDTEIPTNGVKITLHGEFRDPYITINGNSNQIKGSYDGELVIMPDGSIIYRTDCCETEVSVSNWVIPEDNTYGWEIHAGNNPFSISYADGCGTVCVYFEVDALTI